MNTTAWQNSSDLIEIKRLVAKSQDEFRDKLNDYLASDTSQLLAYQKYLSFQYHLTKGVQRYFFRVAASPRLSRMRKLRKFFTTFANEEELHYLVAASDLKALNLDILPEPFDVTLWHAYFKSIVDERPFLRVGAALILENISDGTARQAVTQALSADFLTQQNTKFLVLHQHEVLPHGDQLFDALTSASLSQNDIDDLKLGAQQGAVLYLRMVDWALGIENGTDGERHSLDMREKADIDAFSMNDLELEN